MKFLSQGGIPFNYDEEEWEEDFETIKALKICYKALKNQTEETINAGRKNRK